jgi:hypothetical protein
MSVDRTDTNYAAEGGTIGYGAQFKVGDGASPEVFAAIFGVDTITMGETSVADVVLTHLRSLNAHHEHAPGMLDTSALSLGGIYKPDEWSLSTTGGGSGAFAAGGLPYLAQQRGIHNVAISLPFGSPEPEVSIRGYFTGFSLEEVNTEGVIRWVCGFMPTQAMVLP